MSARRVHGEQARRVSRIVVSPENPRILAARGQAGYLIELARLNGPHGPPGKELEIKGVGFKAQVQGNMLEIALGFSHPVRYTIPEGITIKTAKPTQLVITGIDKVKVGEVAAEIRDYFKPEPYTGKGIRYVGEYVRHKAGKTVVK